MLLMLVNWIHKVRQTAQTVMMKIMNWQMAIHIKWLC